MRLLFLTDNFPPEVNAPASRTFEHCVQWARLGHDVTVVTCAPNFPNGRVFPGYRNRLWQCERVDGIRVVRVWSYITANEGKFRRTLDYVSFMLSAIAAALFLPRPQVVVATSPQFFTACAGFVVSRLKRAPFVFELRDLWPESIRAVGAMTDSFVLRALERVEMFLYRKAAAIVAVTHSFKERLHARGIDEGKIEVITNGVDLTRFAPLPRDPQLSARLGLNGKFVAGYVGTHGLAHGLETVLEAARLVKEWPDADRFRFLFLGDGARKRELIDYARELGLDNVLFLDSVTKDEVVSYWSLLDLSIIHLRDAETFKTVIPSKLFECMGMGIPVLHGVAGESARIVASCGVGLVFKANDARSLAEALQHAAADPALLQKWRIACREVAHEYDRAQLAARMASCLERTIASGRPSL